MPLASQIQHKQLRNTALPYKTFTSPIDQSPQFIAGRNVLTSQKQYCVQRPGFADYIENTPTQFVNLQKIYDWTMFDGETYIVMVVDVIGGIPRVYKYVVGQDDYFVLIHVASQASTTYNFVAANDVVYFANSLECLKWSPVIGVQKWGIDSPAATDSLSEITTNGANSGSGTAWTNPNNVTDTGTNYATVFTSEQGTAVALPNNGGYISYGVGPLGNGVYSTNGKACGFNIPLTATIVGIDVQFSRWVTISGLANSNTYTSAVQLLKASVPAGSIYGPGSAWSLSHVPEDYGGASDLWGAAWTPSDINDPGFGVSVAVNYENTSSVNGVLHAPSFQITVYYTIGAGSPISKTLTADTFGFSAAATFVPSGIVATFNAGSTTATSNLSVQLVVGGAVVGSPKPLTNLTTSPKQYTLGDTGDVWGYYGLTYTQINAANFGLAFVASDGAATTSINDVTLTIYSNGKPSISLVAGTLSAVAGGYKYCTTFFNSQSGGESSPSLISNSTGNFAAQGVQIAYSSSSDPQVDKINIYRTTDGGSDNPRQMALLAQVDNTTGTYTDNTPDENLSATQFAPAFYQNDPPQPMTGLCLYAGRIWMIDDTTVWFSGQEEISNGIPQECVPGRSVNAADGNFYSYSSKLYAVAPLPDGVALFSSTNIEKIEGDSLDTFRRYRLLSRRGTVSQDTVRTVGSSVTWFDVAHQAWLSDAGEFGKDIRPDLESILASTVQMEIHISGEQHWIVLSAPDQSLMYVYDLDTGQWMPPWSVNATCMKSIQIGPSDNRLAIGYQGQYVLMENPDLFLDKNTEYDSWAVVNPIELDPANPELISTVQWVSIEGNPYQPTQVSIATDEDAAALIANSVDSEFGGFRQLTKDAVPSRRRQGIYLTELQYKMNAGDATIPCRRIAVRLDWRSDASPSLWAWYTLDVAHIQYGR